ncbi:hypothetical protein SAMN04515674_11578 [Pseudarcicella hirudinis]|uniref:Short-chain dehydrogenase n=1 Tax=Pseudarcicella hirudinis TaxID=1079859 RepID=A0A1I5XN45_9BACT|nr:SDR family oxidoreductase [Pseudarcicella hirudinis]SFQ33403.1 hypothetical protein SAMN04515674_11578 [Pseudarcicella hirudinis]
MSYALVTGASKGIGKEIAAELARRNFDLLLVARSESLLQEVSEEILKTEKVKINYLTADLSEPNVAEKVYAWVEREGYAVSALVNNAGYGLVGNFDGYSLEENRNMMQLNMITLTEMCHKFLPLLKKQKQGYIMNIASSTAYQALPLMSVYAATKVYVLNFTRGLSYELRNTSVSATVISPGATDTNFNDRANLGDNARNAAAKVSMTPKDVARISVDAMLAKKTEVIPGLVNKLGAFLAWIAPKALTEKVAADIYK